MTCPKSDFEVLQYEVEDTEREQEEVKLVPHIREMDHNFAHEAVGLFLQQFPKLKEDLDL